MAKQKASKIPCCPELDIDRPCDILDFHYRLVHVVRVRPGDGGDERRIPVEVLIHARVERCPGPLALGDLVYSTTLLPGEKVRLFTADRRTRFSFDASTSLSYRNEQSSEEHYYMSSMSDFMSDISIRDEANSANSSKGSFQTKGSTSGILSSIFGSPSVSVNGSHDASSTSSFMRELNQHAQASHNRSVEATRTANSVSVGEVQTRQHAEGETEDHFEAASRVFENPNRCHATSFYFYQINKTQVIRFTIEAINRRVIDPAADTRVTNNPFTVNGDVDVIPAAVLATDSKRLETEEIGRQSAAAQIRNPVRLSTAGADRGGLLLATNSFALARQAPEPLAPEVRRAALAEVDRDLTAVGLIDKRSGEASEETKAQFSFEQHTSLPTPGLFVRGCLDDCNICEPALIKEIELELERKRLQNELLKRQTELLEQSQEYRCCPAGEVEEEVTP